MSGTKSAEEYALEAKWRDRLLAGASDADFRAAYDELNGTLLARRGEGGRVYNPAGRARTDWSRRAILARIPPGARVLDVGGGEGDMALLLARAGNRVTCVDISGLVLERAREAASKTPELEIRFQQADARTLPFADGAFDYAVSEDLIEHLPPADLWPHLGEMRRVVRGGCYIAATPSRLAVGRRSVGFHLRLYSLGELCAAFRRAGLTPAWLDPRLYRRLGRRWEVRGAALRAACAAEWTLATLGLARWPAGLRRRLAPKPLLCGYPE